MKKSLLPLGVDFFIAQCNVDFFDFLSLSSFIRQATAVRKTWLGEVCVRGRLCAPPSHWNRNIFSHALADTDVPVDVARDFDSGRPWLFADLVS